MQVALSKDIPETTAADFGTSTHFAADICSLDGLNRQTTQSGCLEVESI